LPFQSIQYITEDVAMAFGFFDGMHNGHDKVFDIFNEIAEASSLKKEVNTFDQHPSVELNPKRKPTTYITQHSDKIEKIIQQ
ncbi:bifunctional riboflavin kinase/FAD synthetase, partial [Staphylococcus aureus]|nr:bifunctional riboflavin kinase/FAD synthetase [Staphylococcus aureus]